MDVAFSTPAAGSSDAPEVGTAVIGKPLVLKFKATDGREVDLSKLKGKVDHCLNVSASRETARIQETHILAGHVLCQLVDEQLYGGPK